VHSFTLLPVAFFSDGTVEEKNSGRDKLMRKDRDLLVPAAKLPYILLYATDVSRLLQIGSAPVCCLLRTLFAYYRQSLIIYIYVYIYIFICTYIHDTFYPASHSPGAVRVRECIHKHICVCMYTYIRICTDEPKSIGTYIYI